MEHDPDPAHESDEDDRRKRRIALPWAAGAAALALLVGTTGGWGLGSRSTETLDAVLGESAQREAGTAGQAGTGSLEGLSVSGSVVGLFPGRDADLILRLDNRGDQPVTVTAVRITASGAGPGCAADNLVIGDFGPARRVEQGQALETAVPIRLVADAPDLCQGARFPLDYEASFTGA